MPKSIPKRELETIADIIRRHGYGTSVRHIRENLPFELPARTLQRRLNRLEEEGIISSKGSGKGKSYHPKVTYTSSYDNKRSIVAEPVDDGDIEPEEIFQTQRASIEDVVPLSDAAREIKKILDRPYYERHAVGYHTEFLESYIPNETAYLNDQTRKELARLGKVGISGLPAGTYIRQVLDRLLIDLSWNSSRLEGNTYSRLETERLLEQGESAGRRSYEETQMILNHKAAIEMLAADADKIAFNRYTICNLHALLADNLLNNPKAIGTVRSTPVGISGTVFHPLNIPQLIDDHFNEILDKAEAIDNPFESSFFAMVHLPYLQPFEDVNKRVSRLAANIPLVQQNLCPLSFIDVPKEDYIAAIIGVYELNRVEYLRDVFLWAYQRSSARYAAVVQKLGKPDPFRARYRKLIGEFVNTVVTQQMDKGQAARWIADHAEPEVPESDRPRFIEFVETELSCLHPGNIARFYVRPLEFENWIQGWQ